MKANQIKDERILSARREIQSRGYAWVINILLLSIVVQQLLLRAPFAQYAVEFFVLIGCGIYNAVAHYKKGIDLWNPSGNRKKRNVLAWACVSGMVSVAVFSMFSQNTQPDQLIAYFITFVVFFSATRLLMVRINDKKQQAIEKQLDADDLLE